MRSEKIIDSFALFLEMNYESKQTIKTYLGMGKKFVYDNSKVDRMTKKDINEYLIKYKKDRAIRTYNVMCSVVKLIFTGVFKQKEKTNHLAYIKPPNPLIEILSVEEVRDLIANTQNLKHKAILATLYYTGARISELLNIKIENICNEIFDDEKYYKINIVCGKGSKGRSVPVPVELIELLREYYTKEKYKPESFIFESYGKKYSASSVRKIIIKNYKGRKRVYPHLFRHSFATHLVDKGIQLVKLQRLLGHKSMNSVMLYVHLSSKSLLNIDRPNVLNQAA